MLFHTAGFLAFFLPLFLVSFYSAPKGTPRKAVIFLFSYLFYSGSHPFFVLLLFFSSVVDYLVALALAQTSHTFSRRCMLSISIVVNLGLLGFYKYGAMFTPLLQPGFSMIGIDLPDNSFFKSFVLPAGISFYTFQSMSYSIDVYRGLIKPEKSFLGFCNYVAYLPQLIAGPIERFGSLAHQISEATLGNLKPQWRQGINRLCLGIIQKLFLADSCGAIVDVLLVYQGDYPFVSAWAFCVAFGLQIFYDFSAYTHMAIGISLMLGVQLSENFLSPYQSRNIQEFWRRWHITLSTWFRDYVYLPLGGSRYGVFRTGGNLFLTFLVSGLWHGAGWNFVLWGAMHGVYAVGFHLLRRVRSEYLFPRPVAVLITFVAVHFAWVLFRVSDLSTVWNLWSGMIGLHSFSAGLLHPADIIFLIVVTALTQVAPNAKTRPPGKWGRGETYILLVGAVAALFLSPEVVQFIYFQF